MALSKQSILLILTNLLIPIALLTFAHGFFPYKPFLAGLATYEDLGYGPPPEAPFDKVVFMVVDALRSDFVFSPRSSFNFTQSLIRDGTAIPFTAHANAPTITMPRLKALTTGSTPSFLDMILSFAESDTSSSLAGQDTWVAQMRALGEGQRALGGKDARGEKGAVETDGKARDGEQWMYGDDTWYKLFPDTFHEGEGTSSFFVADFTEVDKNVTRHLPSALESEHWNTLILHYLGLDHIGHKTGPRGPHMAPKQAEMDGIVRSIYTAMETQPHLKNTLLVLAGDHGMNEGGNHGGSSPGETSAALVFVSPKLKDLPTYGKESPIEASHEYVFYDEVEQSDVVPTLAALLGFPMPRNSLGKFIPDFLFMWHDMRDELNIFLSNARQILAVIEASAPAGTFDLKETCKTHGRSDLERLACGWKDVTVLLSRYGKESPVKLFEALQKWTKEAQSFMSGTATNYSIPSLVSATALGLLATILSLSASWLTLKADKQAASFFGATLTLYAIMMFASSYVEEEHNFWYWAATGYITLLLLSTIRRNLTTAFSILVILFLLRLTRRWTQSGQKFSGADSITTYLTSHTTTLWVLVLATYFWNCYNVGMGDRRIPWLPRQFARAAGQVLMLLGLTFKLAFVKEDAPELLDWTAGKVESWTAGWGWTLTGRAQVFFAVWGVVVVGTVVSEYLATNRRFRITSIHTLHNLLTLLLLTQSRLTSIPLFLLLNFTFHLLANLPLSLPSTALAITLLQPVSFFALGNTNAISTLDLSSAYNGVSSFSLPLVSLLGFISNFAGPIFWASAAAIMLLGHRVDGEKDVYKRWVGLVSLSTAVQVVGVMGACLVLREHLFVWTVFSPKFLYAAAWGVGVHGVVNLGMVGGLFWLGSR